MHQTDLTEIFKKKKSFFVLRCVQQPISNNLDPLDRHPHIIYTIDRQNKKGLKVQHVKIAVEIFTVLKL